MCCHLRETNGNSFLNTERIIVWVGLAALGLGLASAIPRPAGPAAPRLVGARPALGKLLFFEPALSVNGKRSCASCHRPEKAFTDHRGTPRALRFAGNLRRNSPTILNAAGQARYFHDGRAGSLDAVIAAVLTSPDEFGSSYALATERLSGSPGYRRLFRRAFGAPISMVTINAALVAYLEQQTATASAYDRARAGGPGLLPEAAAGATLFAGAAGCAQCHGGLQFRDGQQHEVAPGQWVKTPTLRNVAVTMPYRADGGAPTLAAVLADAYHRPLPPQPLGAAQVAQLTAFLVTLTDTTSADHRAPAALPRLRALPGRVVGGQY